MPSVIEKTKKDKATGKIEVVMEAPDPNVVCNMRMLRFRREKGLLSWKDKGNTKVIGEGLEKLFGDRLVNNSMQSFGRDLTTQEQVEIRKGKGARFPDSHPAGATKKRKNKGATKTVTQQSDGQVQEAPRTKRTREDDEDYDSADDQNLEYATAASYRKRRRNARGEASRPATNMEDDQDLSATGVAPGFDEVESNPSPPASYYEEDSDDYISKDQDQGDEEYKTRRIHRPIRAMPAKRSRRGAEKAPHLFSAQIQEQTHGFHRDDASQTNATDEDININMNNADGLVDELFSGEAHASVEDQVEADVEEDEDEDVKTILIPVASPLLIAVSPNLPQETDLDRHRRQTRELLGEEDDGFFTRIPWSPGWSCTYPT